MTFASAMDLHLVPPSTGDMNLYGTALPEVTVDYDGELRVNNYMGADEPDEAVGIALVNSNNDDVKVFPNTALQEFSISSRNGNISKLEIFNSQAGLVYAIENNSLQKIRVDAKSWSKGIYFIKVYADAGTYHRKLVLVD